MEDKPIPKSTYTLSRWNTFNMPSVPANEALPTTKLLHHHSITAGSSSSGSPTEDKPIPKCTYALSRWNTFNTPSVPENEALPTTKLFHHHSITAASSSSGSPTEQTLVYTSLKDLLSASPVINSPTFSSSDEIGIHNPLVKKTAWSYLHLSFTHRDIHSRNIFKRVWIKVSASLRDNPVIRAIARAFACLFT